MRKLYCILYLYCLTGFSTLFATNILSPPNNFTTNDVAVILKWEGSSLIENKYIIQISTDSLFDNIVLNQLTSNSYYIYSPPSSNIFYYWRVLDLSINSITNVYSFEKLDPSLINGITDWYDASSNVITNGNLVTEWKDKLGVYDLKQTNPGYQPSFLNNEIQINNKPIVRFVPSGLTSEINFLFNPDSTRTFNDFSFYMVRNARLNNDFFGTIMSSAGPNLLMFYSSYFNSGPSLYYYTGANILSLNNANNVRSNYCIYKYSNNSISLNGNNINSGNSTIPSMPFSHLGTRADAFGNCFRGDIAELILFRKNIRNNSDTDLIVRSYLSNKYAPSLDLGNYVIAGTAFCDTVRIFAPDNFVSYLWSTGETTKSIVANINQTYSLSTKDIFDNIRTSTYYAHPYWKLSNKQIYKCIGDTVKINLGLSATFSCLWSNGINSSSINISSPGLYSVVITDNKGCKFYDTIQVFNTNIKLSVTSANDTIRLCGSEKLYINSNVSIDSIMWDDGTSNAYNSFTNSGYHSVYVRSVNGCVFQKYFYVYITGQAPTADFTSSSLCQNAITSFTDLSVPPAGDVISSWKWNFSNITTATQQNPSTIFTTLGTVSAALKITTNRGCSDSLYKTFTVYKRPKAGFYNLLACSGNPTTFVDTSRAGSGIMSTYFWNFAGLGSSNNTTPVFSFPDVATYNVFHQVTNSYGCTDTITRSVFINPSPVSNFSFDSVCVGGTSYTSFKYLPTIQSPFTIDIFNWDFGDGVQNNSVKNPTHTFPGAGIYNVQLYVQASNQCVDTIQKEVRVFEPVNVDFITSATQCVGKDIQFTDISTSQGLPISNWNWFFAGEGTSSVQNPTHAFNQQGNYVVQLTASNSIGCSGTKQRSIAVSDVPAPNFTFTPSYGLPPLVVNYTNLSPANGSYIWSYGDGTLPVTGYNPPAHTYSGVGTYPIKLISTNYRGCTDSIIKYILVDQAYIDGVMVEVRLIPNGEFYKIQVTITNNSNIEITQMGLSIQLGNGSVIRENWTGSILPSQTTNYTFSGEVKLANENAIPVICASIDNINNQSAENRTDNNTTCKEISIGNFDVISIYPNPANESATFGIMLPRDGKVTILLIDALGQMEYKTSFNGLKGYNNLNVSLLPLNAGVYVAEIIYDNNIVYRKLEKTDKK